jgi:hypothetical protein
MEILHHNPGEQAKLAQCNLVDWFFKEFSDGAGVTQSPKDLGLVTDKPIITEFQQIVAELSRARLVVSTRLHAGMLALAFGRPVVFIAHDTRVASFCEMIGVKPYRLSFDGLAEPIQATRRIVSGDLSGFEAANERLPILMRRLQEWLEEVLAGTRASGMRHPNRAFTFLLKAKTRLVQRILW